MSATQANPQLVSLFDDLCNVDIPQSQKVDKEEQLTSVVQTQNVALNEAVQALGPYLVQTDERIRGRAYHCLNLVLKNLSAPQKTSTPSTALASLVRFLGDRFDDYECVADLLACVVTTLYMWNVVIPVDQLTYLLSQLVAEVNVQSLNQKARMLALDVYDYFLVNHQQLCKIDYVTGFIQAIDGERDPTNLVRIFQIIPRVSKISPNVLASMSEELFEVISVYFPISFNPPADDPRGISAAQLTLGLQDCLACHPSLSNYVIPFLLEKLSSALIETKISTLEAMSVCIEGYGEQASRIYLTEIWTYIRTEVLRSTSLDVIHSALETIKAVARVVCTTSNKNQNQTNMEGIIKPALTEIRSSEAKFAVLYGRMVYAMASANADVCDAVTYRVLQELSVAFYESNTIDKKSSIIAMGTQVLEALNEQLKEKAIPSVVYVSQFWDAVSSALDSKDLKKEVSEALCRLILFPEHVNTDIICSHIVKGLLDEDQAIVEQTITGIEWIYRYNQQIISQVILKALLSQDNVQQQFASVVAAVTKIGTTCSAVSPVIVDCLFGLLTTTSETKNRTEILSTINILLEKAQLEDQRAIDYIKTTIGLVLAAYVSKNQKIDSATLALMSKMVHTIYRELPAANQQEILDQLVQLTLDSKVNAFLPDLMSVENFIPLHGGSPFSDFTFIFGGIFVANRQDVIIPRVKEVVESLASLTSSKDVTADLAQVGAQCLASIVNKAKDLNDDTVQYILNNFTESTIQSALSTQLLAAERSKAIVTISWILKALTLRGAKWTGNLSTVLFTLLNDSDSIISRKAADAFEVIIAEHETILHKKTHARIAVLYKQKFFASNINSLISSIQQAKEEKKGNDGSLLLAVAHLIHNVPKVVVVGEVERLFPLVVSVLTADSATAGTDLTLAALKTTETLLVEAKEQMAKYLSTIVPVLLRLSLLKSSAKVRMTALQCIAVLTSYPYPAIFPIKQTIINGLEKSLDDPKRPVRRLAVKVRNEWFILSKDGGL